MGTLTRLAGIIEITDAERSRFYTELKRTEPFLGIPLLFDLSATDFGAFAFNQHCFPGWMSSRTRVTDTPRGAGRRRGRLCRAYQRERTRPIRSQDYNGTSRIGKLGIEKYYEDILHGKTGYQHVEINPQGRPLRVLDQEAPPPRAI
jgi:penicillin-binding protein 2